jgi:type IV pilus assembly protein PilB
MEQPRSVKIGELLVRKGYITQEQLEEALSVQKRQKFYKPLGEICVELKFLSKIDLQRILRKYQKQIRLGDLLVNLGLIAEEQLSEALEAQKTVKKKIGEILLEKGFITETSLINTLSIQLGVKKIIPDLNLIDTKLLEGINESFLRKNEILPAFKQEDVLTVIMANPLDEDIIRQLRLFFKCEIEPAIASSKDINNAIDTYFGQAKAGCKAPPQELQKDLIIGNVNISQDSNDNIVRMVNFIIANALQEGASDIHIEPQEKTLRVRYRIDGILQHKTDLPISITPSLISRIKILCKLDIAEKRKQQDGRIEARILGKEVDLRVSTYPSIYGESVVIRLLKRQTTLIDIDSVGFSPANRTRYQKMLDHPSGLVLVTGPTGSGKTTTLYASLYYLNNLNKAIITVEDPVENTIEGVIQGQLSRGAGISYMDFIKSMMRQDPDVVMVGEIRDRDAAESVIQLALTGHKVFSTFHTDDTTGALLRLLDMGIDTFLISSTVISVVSQRLVRVLCSHCRQPFSPDQHLLSFFNIRSIDLEKYNFHKANGCERCNNTGFKGRTAIHELLVVDDDIRNAILERMTSSQIRAIARRSAQLVSMSEDGFYKASKGITTLEEVLRLVFHNEIDAIISRSAEEIVALCEGTEYKDLVQIRPFNTHQVSTGRDEKSISIISSASPVLEGEIYRIRIDCETVESEKDRIVELFKTYQKIKEETGDPLDSILVDDFVGFIIDKVRLLKITLGATFIEISIRVKESRVTILAETFIPERELTTTLRPERETGLRELSLLDMDLGTAGEDVSDGDAIVEGAEANVPISLTEDSGEPQRGLLTIEDRQTDEHLKSREPVLYKRHTETLDYEDYKKKRRMA